MKVTLNGSGKMPDDTCSLCSGTGMILDGWTGRVCDCQKEKSEMARLKNAMIPEEFEEARFKNYIRNTDMQKKMFNSMMEYLKKFNEIRSTTRNSFGYIATYGEARLKALSINERVEKMKLHNNYGLGKTHLQIAAARWIIHNIQTVNKEIVNSQPRGCRVVCISDVTFMTEIMSAKREDKKEYFEKLHTVVDYADVLIWDDLGKSKHTESREEMYYEIINERYKRKAPIIFSSNEDEYTLPEKIGFAAADRLLGMAKYYLVEVEGNSYRR
ncbi:ATP-binding protein [Bacillus thuringiensis]|uniref:DnaA ATPase domain-containing protein n=1 Tax=Bacillus thuringiensis TaxID=1428 RepID=UPI00222478F4|nr:ATP-binding protein [Bacillus thuringiensis]UYX52894.1 ATP-binding protein [Bacillus thuringiensis]